MEAIGLASSIITFIDVAYKIVGGAHEVYISQDGATKSNDHTTVVVSDLQRVTVDLRAHQLSSTDQELITLSDKCQQLSAELLQLLHKFLPKTPGKWQSFVSACRILRKQKEAASMEASLDRYRQQIAERLLWLLLFVPRHKTWKMIYGLLIQRKQQTAVSNQEVPGRYAAPRKHPPQLECTEDGRCAMPIVTNP